MPAGFLKGQAMKKRSWFLDPLKLCVAAVVAAGASILAVVEFIIGETAMGVILLCVALLFVGVALYEGQTITIDENGVRRCLLGKENLCWRWEDIREIGVAGAKALGGSKHHHGTLYIYFSQEHMREEDRMRMMLRQPVKDKILLQYTRQRMDAVQMYWSSTVETWNAGDLQFS